MNSDESDEEEVVIELGCLCSLVDVVSDEVAQLGSVLEDRGHPHGATPVHVVEALGVHEFLQDALLHR